MAHPPGRMRARNLSECGCRGRSRMSQNVTLAHGDICHVTFSGLLAGEVCLGTLDRAGPRERQEMRGFHGPVHGFPRLTPRRYAPSLRAPHSDWRCELPLPEQRGGEVWSTFSSHPAPLPTNSLDKDCNQLQRPTCSAAWNVVSASAQVRTRFIRLRVRLRIECNQLQRAARSGRDWLRKHEMARTHLYPIDEVVDRAGRDA